LITTETAVFESPKCSARAFKLTLSLAGCRTLVINVDFDRGIGVTY
jgi:hypothetical protein